jgi:hypothetical protein
MPPVLAITSELWGLSHPELGATLLPFAFIDLGRHFHAA